MYKNTCSHMKFYTPQNRCTFISIIYYYLNTDKNDHDRNDRDRNDRDQNDQTSLQTQMTATVMSPTLMTATKMTGHAHKGSNACEMLL